jgi:DNA-binding transcriptional LysR family regulator
VELDWLQTFLAVVDRGGFTAASEQVHRSQSRVSAHIAALERELGVRLIDRARRPPRLTHAGEVFAGHARDIIASVGSARSAVSTVRGMDAGRLTLLTTPCIGTAFLPRALNQLAVAHPGVQLHVIEQSWHDIEQTFLAEGVGIAVLPALAPPLAPGLCEQPLWRERYRVVVRAGHPFDVARRPVRLEDLVREPLVMTGATGDGVPEPLHLLARRGFAALAAATVDSPQTVVAMARAGVGVGLLNRVAAEAVRCDGTVAVPLAVPLERHVAAYWYAALTSSPLGRTLHRVVLAASVPAGAETARVGVG